MDWRDLFAMQHLHVHSGELQPPSQLQDLILRGLTDEEMRLIPFEGQNSVVWLLWHIARCEDVATNVVLSDRGQVLHDGWGTKMGIERQDIGTGMTPAEVRHLSQTVDVGELRSYRLAVARRTREVVAEVDDAWLGESMTPTEVTGVRDLGTFAEHAGWVGDLWASKPRMWFLWLLTGHSYMHLGEAQTVRSLNRNPVGL